MPIVALSTLDTNGFHIVSFDFEVSSFEFRVPRARRSHLPSHQHRFEGSAAALHTLPNDVDLRLGSIRADSRALTRGEVKPANAASLSTTPTRMLYRAAVEDAHVMIGSCSRMTASVPFWEMFEPHQPARDRRALAILLGHISGSDMCARDELTNTGISYSPSETTKKAQAEAVTRRRRRTVEGTLRRLSTLQKTNQVLDSGVRGQKPAARRRFWKYMLCRPRQKFELQPMLCPTAATAGEVFRSSFSSRTRIDNGQAMNRQWTSAPRLRALEPRNPLFGFSESRKNGRC